MARFILVTLGSGGDVYPFIGIANTLQERGHEVILLANDLFEEEVKRFGHCFCSFGSREEYETNISNPDLWHYRKCLDVFIRDTILPNAQRAYTMIDELHKPDQTVIVSANYVFGSHMAREKLGIPLANVYLQPYSLFSYINPYRSFGLEEFFYRKMGKLGPKIFRKFLVSAFDRKMQEINHFRRDLGLGPLSNFIDRARHHADLLLCLWPKWYCEKAVDWPKPTEITGFVVNDGEIREEKSQWQEILKSLGHKKPLIFTLGTAMVHGREFFQAAAKTCDSLQQPGFLMTSYPDQLPTSLPQNVFHVSYAPFSQLFPQALGVVHHGGIGTIARCMSSGVPQVAVPLGFDQFDNAHIIEKLGIGRSVPFRKLTSQNLSERILEVLGNDRISNRVQRMKEKFESENPLPQIAQSLEALIPNRS
jgi:rhamnosyltransferase subunit B